MLKQNEPFKTSGARRRILVVDDELINREMLSICLQDSYEILQAGDGAQAMEILRSRGEEISLVLLDILMPVMSGMEVLAEMRGDPVLSRIPVIVLTADSDAEVECLKMGAADFIPKPYPAPAVVQARVLRTIELSEDREIINSTERDTLTGLYNRDYFYRYAEQYDQHHKETPMDAMIVDVNHFHMINERFGTARGDEVLRSLAEALREEVFDTGGIVCRR
ncbi:MAG: response regulator, partial [Lachnospiraceae bacterium]|nr:response regulator [Lachnospiraceae bacterium]